MLYESNHSECNIDNTSTARTTTYLRRLEVSSVIVLSYCISINVQGYILVCVFLDNAYVSIPFN